MDTGTTLALVGVFLNALVLVASAVWVVASIRGTNSQLKLTLEHIQQAVNGLRNWLEKAQAEIESNRRAIAVLQDRDDRD